LGCFAVDLSQTDTLLVQFVAEDADECQVRSADTLSVMFNIQLPENQPPQVYFDVFSSDSLFSVFAGDSMSLGLIGQDPDDDSITVQLVKGSDLYELTSGVFEPVSGYGPLSAIFEWQTTCSLLEDDFSPRTYEFSVVISDHQCLVPQSDTLEFQVEVTNRPADYDFLPPNVFTPNRLDNYNEEFHIPNLPVDNCEGQFERIIIINRWGMEVFRSRQRDFSWDGAGVVPGVYYYSLHYTHKTFKGTVSVIR
jgi:hypothetical protein